MDKKELQLRAKEVFDICLSELDSKKWVYDADEENLLVKFVVKGEDLPLRISFLIDAERQLITVYSPIVTDAVDKIAMLSVAVSQINTFIADGRFITDINNGTVYFKINSCYMGSLIGEEVFDYLIDITCYMVDEYNEKLQAIADGELELSDFLQGLLENNG